MTDYSTYGVIFSLVSGSVVTPVAGVTEVGEFEMEREVIDATSHDSGDTKKFITKPLTEIADLPITLKMDKTSFTNFNGYFASGSAVPVQIEYPDGTKFDFSAVVPKIKLSEAKTDSDDLMTFEVTFKVSGSIVIA